MLKPCRNIGTMTYSYIKGFYVDIVTDKECYNAWLYHEDVGDKHYMFGMMKNSITYNEFIKVVEKNIPYHVNFIREKYKEDFE